MRLHSDSQSRPEIIPGLCFLLALGLIGGVVGARAESDPLAKIRQAIGSLAMPITNKVTITTDESGKKPPLKYESWTFNCGAAKPTINYSRFLNQPPLYTGQYASLANSDMGVGFDGGALGNWYRGNAIRVLINGADIFSQKPAKLVETSAGSNGHLRITWELDKGGELALNFTVPEDGHAIYGRVEIVPGALPVNSLLIQLSCFPGGYGPAYKLPSHRCVSTAKGEWGIPPDFKVDTEHPFPKALLEKEDDWIFYEDKLLTGGSLGLLVRKADGASGKVSMSTYGQFTELNYPVNTRQIHLAFYAFDTENRPAHDLFMSSLDSERAILTEIHSRSGTTNSSSVAQP